MALIYKKYKSSIFFFKLFFFKGQSLTKKNVFFIFFKVIGFFGMQNFLIYFFLFKHFLVLRTVALSLFLNSVNLIFYGVSSGWFMHFILFGYNYRLKSSFFGSFLLLYLGFFYSLLFKFPSSVKIFRRKRAFLIFSTNLLDFNFTVSYLRHLRDLYPYKSRGLIFNRETFKFKQGKKVKFR